MNASTNLRAAGDFAVVNHDWFFSVLVADTLWAIALCYYIYITFLGYSGER